MSSTENYELSSKCLHNYKPSSFLYEMLNDFREKGTVTIIVYQTFYCPRCLDKKEYFLYEGTFLSSQSQQIHELVQKLKNAGFKDVKS